MEDVKPAMTRKPEFVERVAARSGLKKRDVKSALDAVMAELTETLLRGDELVLPPMGRIRAVKTREVGGGAHVMTLKLRTMKEGAGGATDHDSGVAESDDAD